MTYVNTGWQGPPRTPVVEAVKERIEYESYNGPTSTEVLDAGKEVVRQAREGIAGLINASPDEILLTDNTTEGLNVVMSGLPWQRGDEIITCDLEHPAVLMPSYHTQERHGVNVKVLRIAPNESHEGVLEKIEAALTDRTRMVFLSHVEFSTGLRMPAKEIRRLTEARGIWLLLDGAQGPGHIELDVKEIGCDFYSTPGQKWLLGPAQTGALYIRKEMVPMIEPTRVGFNAVKSFDYEGGYEPKTDEIDKFTVSTMSVPLRAGYLEAVRLIASAGMREIEARSLALAARFKAALADAPGVEVLSPLDGPGHSGLATFRIDGADHEEASRKLWETDRIVIRSVAYPPSLRLSAAFFNTEDEIDRVATAVRRLADQR